MRTLLTTVLAAAALAAAGCGGTADVSGKVSYQGKAVVFGTVVVIGPDGVPQSGPVRPDGTYHVAGVAAGEARVTVSSPPPPGAEPAGAKERKDDDKPTAPAAAVDPAVVKNWFPLPERFADPDKSGLGKALKAGSNAIDLELK